MKRYLLVILLVACCMPIAFLQQSNPEAPFFDYRSEAPGAFHDITPADLPAPFMPAVNVTIPVVSSPAATWPEVPDGFVVDTYVTGLSGPRLIRRAPNGDLFVAETGAGQIRVLRDAPGAPPRVAVFAAGLSAPFGIAFFPPSDPAYVYIANTNSIVRFPYESGDLQARGPSETVVSPILALDNGGHSTRDIAFSLDERTMYISVGSASNVDDVDKNPAEVNRANILETSPEGGPLHVFASGIRNPVGLIVDPSTGALWTAVNERDELGNNLPPDYVTEVRRGGFYGWPWFYTGGNQDPRHAGKHPELKQQVIVPDVLLQPHSAPLGLTIYDGEQFGSRYADDLFVAAHGSWNRSVPTAYEVVRVRRIEGRATGAYQDFMTGFVAEDGTVRGRPVGVAVTLDGSLIVTDDLTGVVWRVRTRAAASRDGKGRE